ncbi:MAG TPA: hypothetical protein VLD38_01255 [Nitrosopumilaceae archaeon]|nr:hypothetical protein [Nitrosopumilaceae archaeon]
MFFRRHSLALLFFFSVSGYFISLAYADGLASETLPPVIVGGRSITLTIGSTPASTTDPSAGTEIGITLNENENPISDVTFAIESMKGDKVLFSHTFKSDNGGVLLLMSPQKSGDVSIDDNYGGGLSGLFGQNTGNAVIKGPIFDSGGLYKFKIDILTMDSYENKLSQPIGFKAAISIPEITTHQIHDNDYGNQTIGLVAYYDQINNFNYNAGTKFLNFSMPFDWSEENIDQVSVVHQEIRIPRTFGDFLVTKYEAYVNNVPLPDETITIDDYSSDNRTIHIFLSKKELQEIEQENPETIMNFSLHPSDEAKFPITAFTRNAQYKVSLSWDPPKIIAGSNTKFYFKVLDPYLINKTVASVNYDFSLFQNQKVIFQKRGVTTNFQTENNEIEVPIPNDSIGPITIAFENLSGNSFAGVEFTSVVTKPNTSHAFPIKLTSFSIQDGKKVQGRYDVDLTWFPSTIQIGEQTEFVFTIKDKNTGRVAPQSAYDFVILQKGKEVFRKSGIAPAGGDYVDYTFSNGQDGSTTLRIENINNSGETVEIPFVVTPEFPLGLLSIITIGFLGPIIFSRLK